jgi:hypothetical protein
VSAHAVFHEQVIEAVLEALFACEEDHAVAACPDCGTVLIITPGFTDHMPPLCARWAEYAENWDPPAGRAE